MSVQIKQFGTTRAGEPVQVAVLKNEHLEAHILSYAAAIQRLIVPDRSGKPVDVVLGYPDVEGYEANGGAMGSVVGRFANRIAGAKFYLNAEEYHVTVNDHGNCLHSGEHGFMRTVFEMEPAPDGGDGVLLRAVSPDGTDGFPGNVTLEVLYTLAGSGLMIQYTATTDAPTVINITNHSYFNLNGHGNVLTHTLQVAADSFLEGDENCLPTGRILPVDGTAMDFRTPRMVGEAVDSDEPCVKRSGGYDSNFLLRGTPAAVLHAEESGITLTVTTDQPGVQVYSANFLTRRPGKNGATYDLRSGLCLETQHYPDAIHHPDWPTCVLKAGMIFKSFTRFAFSAK